jgi:hypothetical protein
MGTKRIEIEEYWNKGNIWEQTMNEQTEKRKIKKQTIIFRLNKAVDRLTNQPFIQHPWTCLYLGGTSTRL